MNRKSIGIIGTLLLIAIVCVIGLGSAFIPLVLAFFLAYLFFPLIQKLEKKGLSRNKAVLGVFSLLTIILTLSLTLLIPEIIRDAKGLLKELPQFSTKAIIKVEEISKKAGLEINISKSDIKDYIESHIAQLSKAITNKITLALKSAFSGLTQWIVAILNLFLIPLFFFHVISDYEIITGNIKSLIPRPYQSKIEHYMSLTNTALSGYIRGQFIVALILALLYATGLSLIGLRFGFSIGILSGLISIIPYAGFAIGFSVAIVVALANMAGMDTIYGVVAVYVIVQAIEGTIVTPKFVGDKVGLSALATILALIIGGNIFGMFGMLVAIPVAAVLKAILRDLKTQYQQLDLYKN